MRSWLIGILIAVALGGCTDAPYVVSRTLFQIECNPTKVPGNHCVPITKKSE